MHRKIFLFLLTFVLLALTARAQDGLSIATHFGGRYADRIHITEVKIKGGEIKKAGISLFRSLKMPGSATEVEDIERSVRADASQAISKTIAMRGNRLYYGFYELKGSKSLHRYIFFRNDAVGGKKGGIMTLVYIEGKADKDAITRRFGNKK